MSFGSLLSPFEGGYKGSVEPTHTHTHTHTPSHIHSVGFACAVGGTMACDALTLAPASSYQPMGTQMFFTSTDSRRNSSPSPCCLLNQSRLWP